MCQSSKDGPGSLGTDHQGLPLHRQTCVYATVQAVCQTPPGVLHPGWSPWTETDKSCLEKMQQRAVRQVSGLTSTTYEEKLLELGLPTLKERRHQADMCMVHKILHGKGELKADTWFEMAGHGARAMRAGSDPLNIRVEHGRLDMRRNFFSLRVIDSWNQIPSEIKRIEKCDAESCPVAPCLIGKARANQPRCEQGATRSGCSLRGPTWTMGDDLTSK